MSYDPDEFWQKLAKASEVVPKAERLKFMSDCMKVKDLAEFLKASQGQQEKALAQLRIISGSVGRELADAVKDTKFYLSDYERQKKLKEMGFGEDLEEFLKQFEDDPAQDTPTDVDFEW